MRQVIALVLVLISHPASARELMPQEKQCLKQIREEADFILSRIDVVHQEYENKIKATGLTDFKSGNYSTIGLLDNTIRKYHRDLVHKVKSYPFNYKAKISNSKQKRKKRCMADKLQADAVGTIHGFELHWQKAFRQAEKNANYFRNVDSLN